MITNQTHPVTKLPSELVVEGLCPSDQHIHKKIIMFYSDACKMLELSSSEGKRKSIINKNYRRLSLLNHPDKNENSDATEKFQEINEARELLIKTAIDDVHDRYPYSANVWNERILPLLQQMGYETPPSVTINSSRVTQFLVHAYDTTLLSKLDTMNHEKLQKIYTFICKHRHRYPAVVDPLINYIGKIIKSTAHKSNYKDQHTILYPKLEELLRGDILQYKRGGRIYHIPSWNTENVFDMESKEAENVVKASDIKEGGEFIVHCIPACPEGVTVDEEHTVHKDVEYTMNELWELPDNVNCRVEIAPKHMYSFEKSFLKLVRTPQIVPFYCKGIPLSSSVDVLDASNKGKVILHVTIL